MSIAPDFSKKHVLNRAYVHYFIATLLNTMGDKKRATNHIEQATREIENKSEKYNRLLSLLYYEFGFINRLSATLNKALKFSEEIKDYGVMSFVCSLLAYTEKMSTSYSNSNENKRKKFSTTFQYYHKAEAAFKKSKIFDWNVLWKKHYSNKISLFYNLDYKPPPTERASYKDSIFHYFNLLESDYLEQKINATTFNYVIKFNINPLIKIGEYNKARTYMNELESEYSKDFESNCYNIALLNMNKYVWERTLGTDKSYLKALYNAYNHIQSCENPDSTIFYTLNRNILIYLTKLETKLGNYKKAVEWSEKKSEFYAKRGKEYQSENKEKQAQFWANREKLLAQHNAKLNQEKAELLELRFYILVATTFVLTFLLIGIYRMNARAQRKKKELVKNREQLRQNNLRLKSLKDDLEKSTAAVIFEKQKAEKELSSKLQLISQRNELFSILEGEVNNLNLEHGEKIKLTRLIKANDDEGLWKEIKEYYLEKNKEFISLLLNRYPQLTPANVKLCIFIKLGLSIKEIASLTFSTPNSVIVARGRLHKKLGIEMNETNMYDFLNSIS